MVPGGENNKGLVATPGLVRAQMLPSLYEYDERLCQSCPDYYDGIGGVQSVSIPPKGNKGQIISIPSIFMTRGKLSDLRIGSMAPVTLPFACYPDA